MALVEQYGLGQDFVPSVASMILGCPPGGGEADISIRDLEDGSGLEVTIHRVTYDCTKAEWERIFHDVIQPTLLTGAG